MNAHLAWLLPALPAAAFVVVLTTGHRLPRRGAWLVVGATLASTVGALLLLASHISPSAGPASTHVVLGHAGGFVLTAGTQVDSLSALLCLMVGVVASCVQLYSLAYLRDDARYRSYAAIVSLFTAAMLVVVLSSDLLELLVGWEVMGICSYLLIGHHDEERPARDAAISAFLVTRFGDLGFTAGILTLGFGAGSFQIRDVLATHYSSATLTAAGLLLLLGVVGKSAQFPLQTWLPDAMTGPTPVSALIHAATMVAAGVAVLTRLLPLLQGSQAVLGVLAVVAAITMVLGALAALAQDDLKRVLAWSTVSQLAYMYAALALSAPSAAMLHLVSHAAFKALLFLAAGCVLHAVGTGSMTAMGGLRRSAPVTAACTAIGLAGLVGLPPTSGFTSKDAVLTAAWHSVRGAGASRLPHSVAWVLLAAAMLTVAITAAYALRVWLLVFSPRGGAPQAIAHEPSWLMRGPVAVLAGVVLLLGLDQLLAPQGWRVSALLPGESDGVSWSVAGLSLALAFVGFAITAGAWRRGAAGDPAGVLFGRSRGFVESGFGMGELYRRAFARPVRDRLGPATARVDEVVLDGAVVGSGRATVGTARLLRFAQSGNPQVYVTALLGGALLVVLAVTRL